MVDHKPAEDICQGLPSYRQGPSESQAFIAKFLLGPPVTKETLMMKSLMLRHCRELWVCWYPVWVAHITGQRFSMVVSVQGVLHLIQQDVGIKAADTVTPGQRNQSF